MDVKGEHQFDVSVQELWNYLMDVEVLAKITPGISKLELIETDKYNTISDIKIGPVKGSFKGDLEVVDKQEPDSFAIKMVQLSKIGNAHVKVDMQIKQDGDSGSILNFDGKAKLSGVIARTGQRVLSGVANTITKEVFASLEKHIQEDQETKGAENSETIESEQAKVAESVKAESVLEEETQLIEPPKEVSEEVKEKVSSTTNEKINNDQPLGFFASIINFFKNLFS